jgi:hypothetical protein
MPYFLHCHPWSACPAVTGITVAVTRKTPAALHLHYQLTGDIAALCLPEQTAPHRGEKLWEHSCFEIFLRTPGNLAYTEYNFAPTSAWAAYVFSAYRKGHQISADSIAEEFPPPDIRTQRSATAYDMQVDLSLPPFADITRAPVLQIGLSAIVEDAAGAISYWALAHPDGKADFHHDACFAAFLEKEHYEIRS